MNIHNKHFFNSHVFTVGFALLLVFTLLALTSTGFAQQSGAQDKPPQVGGQAYAQAHAQIQNPAPLLGGPLDITLTQQEGGARWIFPGPRELDSSVFGTPQYPLGFEQAPPGLYGVALDDRATNEAGDAYTTTKDPTSFSDTWKATSGSITMHVVDATATDAAVTNDKIDFEADFESPGGQHSYKVTVKQPLTHGFAYPFFGGVVTNTLLHGFTGVGTPLMPTEFTYVAFWGVGTISRDGEIVNDKQLVHVMVTEFVRGDNYELQTDGNVPAGNPRGMTLHLMIPPYQVTGGTPPVKSAPVKTGIMVDSPQGRMEQPFFHVMFSNFELSATRGTAAAASSDTSAEATSGGAASGGADSGGASGGSSQKQADTVVAMENIQFQPSAITIQAGQTIEFVNKDSFTHTVHVFTEDGQDIYPDTRVASGDSVFVTIDRPGTYQLECTIHAGMTGTITVN